MLEHTEVDGGESKYEKESIGPVIFMFFAQLDVSLDTSASPDMGFSNINVA